MADYISKYFSCEEMDQRMLQGWYDDVKKKGYTGTKEEFDQKLASLLDGSVGNLEGALFAGIATPETNPGVPSQKVFYLTSQSGTYPNFNDISVLEGEIAVLSLSDGQWIKQRLALGGGGSITIVNEPDEEDLTTDQVSVEQNVIRFKNRAYDEANASGKGYKILRKNWQTIEGVRKNILIQDMINDANTIYEIRYDFDLNGAYIQIKDGCILNFVGGSLSNGTIDALKNFTIKADDVLIFNNITFERVIKSQMGNPYWFGAKGDGETDDTTAIQNCVNNFETTLLGSGFYLISSVIVDEIAVTLGREIINHGSIISTGNGISLNEQCSFSGGRIYSNQNATAITIGRVDDNETHNRISVNNVQILGGEYGIKCVAKEKGNHYNAFCYISNVNIYGCKHGFYGNIRSSYINVNIEECEDNFNLTDGSLNTIIIRGNASQMNADYPNFMVINGEGNTIIPNVYDIGVGNNQKKLSEINGTNNKIVNSVNSIVNSDTSNSFDNPYFAHGMLKAMYQPKYEIVYNNVKENNDLLNLFNPKILNRINLELIDTNKEGYIEFRFGEVFGFVGIEFIHMFRNAAFLKIEARREPNDTEPFLSITNRGVTDYTGLFSNTYKDFANYNQDFIAQNNKNLSIRCFVKHNMAILGASIYAHNMNYNYPIGDIKTNSSKFSKGDVYFATDIKATQQDTGTLLIYNGTDFYSFDGKTKNNVQRVYKGINTNDVNQVLKLTIPLNNPSYSFVPIKFYNQDYQNTFFSEFLIGLCGTYNNLTINIIKQFPHNGVLNLYIYSKIEGELGTFIIAYSKGVGVYTYSEIGQVISNQTHYALEPILEPIDIASYKEQIFSLSDNSVGTTQQRPTLTSQDEGFQYYDTTLKKYVVWDGTKWVDMGSGGIGNLVKLTQEEYDSLIEKDKDKLYVIVG